jgi:hypothetical protein
MSYDEWEYVYEDDDDEESDESYDEYEEPEYEEEEPEEDKGDWESYYLEDEGRGDDDDLRERIEETAEGELWYAQDERQAQQPTNTWEYYEALFGDDTAGTAETPGDRAPLITERAPAEGPPPAGGWAYYEALFGRDRPDDQPAPAPAPAPGAEVVVEAPTTWADGTPMDDKSQRQARVYQIFREEGHDAEGARVAVAVTEQEGGLYGAVNRTDPGGSYGPFQLNAGGGEFNNFVPWVSEYLGRPVSREEAFALAADIDLSSRFAARNYLGNTIKRGQAQNIHGSDLATYAQRYGQVSVQPWVAGQHYGRMFATEDPFEAALAVAVPKPGTRAKANAQLPPGHHDGDGHKHGVATPYTQEQVSKDGTKWTVAFDYDQPYTNPFNPAIPRHRGVDLQVTGMANGGMGTPYTAFRNGRVAHIIVDTGDPNGRYDRYFHNNAVSVKEGDQVVAGQTKLGIVGETGTKGFPHLHYEVSQGINGDPMGRTIDPRPFIGPPSQATAAATPPPRPPQRGDADVRPRAAPVALPPHQPGMVYTVGDKRVSRTEYEQLAQKQADERQDFLLSMPEATRASYVEWEAYRKSRGLSPADIPEFRAHLGRLGAPDPWQQQEQEQARVTQSNAESRQRFLAQLPEATQQAYVEWEGYRKSRGEDPGDIAEFRAHLDRLGAPNPWAEQERHNAAVAANNARVAQQNAVRPGAPGAAPGAPGTRPVYMLGDREISEAEYRRLEAENEAEQARIATHNAGVAAQNARIAEQNAAVYARNDAHNAEVARRNAAADREQAAIGSYTQQ